MLVDVEPGILIAEREFLWRIRETHSGERRGAKLPVHAVLGDFRRYNSPEQQFLTAGA